MKFLVVATTREMPPVPREQLLEMSVGEWQTALQFRKEGKAEVNYALAGLKGGTGILEIESGAELNALLSRLPFYPFLDVQIYPLMTVEEALTQAKQSLETFKAQKCAPKVTKKTSSLLFYAFIHILDPLIRARWLFKVGYSLCSKGVKVGETLQNRHLIHKLLTKLDIISLRLIE